MRVCIIRQRPAIGDCLLLAPLISQVRRKHPKPTITVITDPAYMCGALPTVFGGIPGVDRIECIDSQEWTTEDNRRIDARLQGASTTETPYSVKNADLVLNCNSAFMEFEREHNGRPPYGIAEFWLKHHGYYEEGVSLLPQYEVSKERAIEVEHWLELNNPNDKPMVGIVARAGDSARDWDYDGKSSRVADWLHTSGYLPIGIDPYKKIASPYAINCIGHKIDFVAALLARMRLVLTPDTGILHLAQAVGTPTVALWGIMPPELRVKGYDCIVVPKRSLGFCQSQDELRHCQCRWKFQRWSCLHRLTLNMIIAGLEEALSK